MMPEGRFARLTNPQPYIVRVFFLQLRAEGVWILRISMFNSLIGVYQRDMVINLTKRRELCWDWAGNISDFFEPAGT